jgi:transcriptional regulator with XRE-family HTH domain
MRKIPDDKVRHVIILGAKGLPQKEIAAVVGISAGMVNKILKGNAAPPPAEPSSPTADDVPDDVPEGVSVDIVDKWIKKVEQAAEAAQKKDDFSAMSALTTKLVALLEHKRKAAPPPPPDPNANPDFIEAARRARERLHKLIDTAVEK